MPCQLIAESKTWSKEDVGENDVLYIIKNSVYFLLPERRVNIKNVKVEYSWHDDIEALQLSVWDETVQCDCCRLIVSANYAEEM